MIGRSIPIECSHTLAVQIQRGLISAVLVMIIQKRRHECERPVPEYLHQPFVPFAIVAHKGHDHSLRISTEGHCQSDHGTVGQIQHMALFVYYEGWHLKREEQFEVIQRIHCFFTDELILQQIYLLEICEMNRGGQCSHQAQQTVLAGEFTNGILQSFHWSFAVTLQAEIQYEAAAKDLRKKLRKDQRRRDELDVLLKRLYESYALGKLPEKRYEALSAEYEQEQAALEISLAEDQRGLEIFLEDTTRIDQFMELAKKYTDLSELTTPMLNEFVDKILVHAPVKDPKYGRMQQVDVYLNFVGCVQIPSPEPTAEELEELERLARCREINKRTYARRKERERQKKLLALEQAG